MRGNVGIVIARSSWGVRGLATPGQVLRMSRDSSVGVLTSTHRESSAVAVGSRNVVTGVKP